MIIKIRKDLSGSILDIGGGGEAVIGRIYRDRVTAIDNLQEELDEAPDCCTKLLMDAAALSFADNSFDNVTFFYSLMFMSEETQRKALREAARVLKPGGVVSLWDCDIASAYPEPFTVDLDIRYGSESLQTCYGILKQDPQSSESVLQLLEAAGLRVDFVHREDGQFHIQCGKQ